nr:hypothetical protein [uncultured Pseudodesulfovibrio sp.]
MNHIQFNGATGEITKTPITQPEIDEAQAYISSPGYLIQVKAGKQAEITAQAEIILKVQAEEYGAMEMATWDQQYREAEAYQADNQAVVPLLSAIAASRGMTVATLADRIITNRAAWVALSGSIVGQRLAYQDMLDAAETVAEVEAIEIGYVVPG